MPREETDIEYLQDDNVIAGQIDGLAGGIMDLFDNKDPDHSAAVEAKEEPEKEAAPAKEAEAKEEEVSEEAAAEEKSEEPETWTIKWQGQEKDVTQEELISLAQQGFDYTQKTQKLSEERDQLAPYIGLAKKIKDDPLLANQIASYLSSQPQQPQKPQKQFDDPIEQLKWETKQEALAEIRQELQQQLQPVQRQQVLNAVKAEVQRDPDYPTVHQAILDMLASQPPSLQKTLYMQLDQDPQAYLEAFTHIKKRLETNKPKEKEPVSQETKVVKKTTRAPILEAGGVATTEEVTGRERTQRLSKQKASALRSGDNTQLAAWLEASGSLDHLY